MYFDGKEDEVVIYSQSCEQNNGDKNIDDILKLSQKGFQNKGSLYEGDVYMYTYK